MTISPNKNNRIRFAYNTGWGNKSWILFLPGNNRGTWIGINNKDEFYGERFPESRHMKNIRLKEFGFL